MDDTERDAEKNSDAEGVTGIDADADGERDSCSCKDAEVEADALAEPLELPDPDGEAPAEDAQDAVAELVAEELALPLGDTEGDGDGDGKTTATVKFAETGVAGSRASVTYREPRGRGDSANQLSWTCTGALPRHEACARSRARRSVRFAS